MDSSYSPNIITDEIVNMFFTRCKIYQYQFIFIKNILLTIIIPTLLAFTPLDKGNFDYFIEIQEIEFAL